MKFWKDRFDDIYLSESKHWVENGFVETRSNEVVEFQGSLELRLSPSDGPATVESFEIKVSYLEGYPYRPPEVTFISPPVKGSRHQSPSGAPCLFAERDWDPSVPASEVEKKILQWLRGYRFKSFPNELPIYELPDYYHYAAPTILYTEDLFQETEGKLTGRFSYTPFHGRNIAILSSVDGTTVGSQLTDELRLSPDRKKVGRWFRVSNEPSPFQLEAHLTAFLAREGHTLKMANPGKTQVVGLVFEDRHLQQTQWMTYLYGSKKAKSKPKPNRGWPLRSPRSHLISRDELFKRIESIRSLEDLGDTEVTIFGAGAIGSHAALGLAREGVDGFAICDPDVLRPGNVTRHALNLTDVGRPKADAVADAIAQSNPFASIQTFKDGLLNPHTMAGTFRDSGLVLGCIGDDTIEEMLAEVVVEHNGPPLLLARTLRGGEAIRIIRVIPGQDPCLTCLKFHAHDDHEDLVDVPDDQLPDVYDNGCSTAARPGTGVASEHAAVLLVETAVSLLMEEETEANQWLQIRKGIEDGDHRISSSGMIESCLPIHPECPHCSND